MTFQGRRRTCESTRSSSCDAGLCGTVEVAAGAALLGGVAVYILRWLQDRPTSQVLGERVKVLEAARKEEKIEREELKSDNVRLKATAETALEMALQKARVEELHFALKEATTQNAQEHRQITTVLSSLSQEHHRIMEVGEQQSRALERIMDRMMPKRPRWDQTTERRQSSS